MTVRDRISQERARLRRLTLAAGAGAAVAGTALLLAVAVYLLAEARWIELPAVLPIAVWLCVAAVVGAVVWLTARTARRDVDERTVAEAVEREQRLRSGALRGVLEVSGSGVLARRAEERLSAQLGAANGALAPELRRRTARRGGAAATVGMLGMGALAFSAADAPDGWTVLAHPVRAMTGSLLPALHVVDAPPAVMRGEPLELVVAAPGRRTVLVRHRATGGAWVSERLPVADGRAVLRVSRMEADLAVIASDGRASRDSVLVPVTDRPFLGNVSVTATFPAYLQRQPETLPLGEPVRVPQGTELRVQGSSTTELRHVLLAPDADGDGDTLRLAVEGRTFSGRLVAARSGRWSWAALGTRGDAPHVPPPLELQVTPDSAPRVLILSPGRDTLVLPTSSVSLTLAASDDHGLGDVVLRAWRQRGGEEPDAERATRLEPAGQPEWSGGAELSLAAYELQPGDEVHVIATATDQSPWRQSASSRELVLRVATLAEQRANVRETADSVIARALAAAAAQRSLAQRTEDASRARDRGNTSGAQRSADGDGEQGTAMSFESAERAKALANEQRQLQEQVEQTRDAAEQLEKQLEQAGAMDEELQQRMREVQQMLRDAITPQMAEQLRKLEEAAQKLSPEQTRRALGDLAQQQKAMREQLERSVEMLKRAALEGAMETLRDEAQDLSDAQQQLADSLRRQSGQQQSGERQSGQPQSAQQQSAQQRGEQQGAQGQQSQPQPSSEELARRTEALAREVQELQQRLAQQKADAGAKRAAEAAKHSDASADAMREAARQQAGSEGREQPQEGAERQGAQQQQGNQQQAGQQQTGQQQAGEQKAGQQQGQRGEQGQQGRQGEGQRERQGGRQQDGGQQGGGGSGAQAAQQAAEEMRQASEQLAQARQDQVNEWKQDLSAELDRSISELQQLAREQQQLEQQARNGASGEQLRSQQSAVQQGVQQTNQRLQEAGKSSSLLSQRSQQMVAQAQNQVQQASQAAGQSKSAQQAAPQMRSAADALNQAAASLARDRARVNSAQSASGFAEQMEEMQKLAQQQGALSQDAAGMLPGPGTGQPNAAAQEQARRLSQQQRAIAEKLGHMSDKDGSGRTDALAAEAERLAQQLAGGSLDQDMVNRQQRLFRRMLDAGRTLEKDEIDEEGKREAETARPGQLFTPSEGSAAGRSAQRFRLPTWNELRELSPEERRLVLEYFRRLNAEPGAPPPAPPAPAAPPPRTP